MIPYLLIPTLIEALMTPFSKRDSTKPIPLGDRPKELPMGFVLPSKFGKVTDRNLQSGNIVEIDRAKVIKTVATCVCLCTVNG